jgi:predicted TIM-barrel fold metal-dependent hydrolase
MFDRFPDLKIVMAHFGGGIAAVKDRLIAKGIASAPSRSHLGDYYDMIYFDMAGFEGGTTAPNCALEGICPEWLVFATDYRRTYRRKYGYGEGNDGVR